jgi:DNA polymerase elongation subunit (family B)
MGIVLKRRDNAPIVKIVVNGIVDEILNKRNPKGAYEFCKKSLKDIITGKYKLDKFIITKTLKSTYKDRLAIAHAVLADRMGKRDPGNKPQSNDRIPYVYIETDNITKIKKEEPEQFFQKYDSEQDINSDEDERAVINFEKELELDLDKNKEYKTNKYMQLRNKKYVPKDDKKKKKKTGEVKQLQGDKIETPDYIIKNKLKVDYLFYITNQIMKPSLQFLELIIDNADRIFKEYIIKEENRKKCMMPVAFYADSESEEEDKFENIDKFLEKNDKYVKVKSPKKSNNKRKEKIKSRKEILEEDLVDFFDL